MVKERRSEVGKDGRLMQWKKQKVINQRKSILSIGRNEVSYRRAKDR